MRDALVVASIGQEKEQLDVHRGVLGHSSEKRDELHSDTVRSYKMAVTLFDYQLDAIERMKNGCILCGGVGSGKSLTAIAYYYLQNGGAPDSVRGGEYYPMDDPPPDLYIITTARKRDTFEWRKRMALFFFLRKGDSTCIRL
jgi:hypothetical protein